MGNDISEPLKKLFSQTSPEARNPPSCAYLNGKTTLRRCFYGLTKIHKPAVPLRPITSSINCPTYQVSKHLASILSPVQNNKYTVTNSCDFVGKVSVFNITPQEIMVSFDVVSLFTSIPTALALQVTKNKLEADLTILERTNMSVDSIMNLLEFVLDNNYFIVDGTFYKQIFGCPMGSPVCAILANLVMEYVEVEL